MKLKFIGGKRMFELNRDGTRAIMPINDMANICGYFFNAELDDSCETSPNNGYNCKHPECGEIQDDIGCCMCSSCPMGWEADEEDCDEFGIEYEEGEYIVTEEQEILDELSI